MQTQQLPFDQHTELSNCEGFLMHFLLVIMCESIFCTGCLHSVPEFNRHLEIMLRCVTVQSVFWYMLFYCVFSQT